MYRWLKYQRLKLAKNSQLKMVVLAIALGVITGCAAALFFFVLEWAKAIVLEGGVGLELQIPPGDQIISVESAHHLRESINHRYLSFMPNWLLIILVPSMGCGLAAYLVRRFAPEAAFDGTSAFVNTFHNKGAIMRFQAVIVKAVASIITLAFGGSGGKEGPVAQVGAGFGCWLARKLKLSERERRQLFLAGCAGGLGAIFRAPLGAAITAIEVLYKEDFESDAIMPSVIASVTSFSTFMLVFGHHTIFNLPEIESFKGFVHIPAYLLLALCCSLIGALYVSIYHRTKDVFQDLNIPVWSKAFVGGGLTGALALLSPYALGDGWGAIQLVMDEKLTIGVICLAVFLKIFATSFTMGSGGSAGIFGPSLFIGAMTGGLLGTFLHNQFPESSMLPSVTAFTMVGMAAFFAGVANAPIASIIMVCEITGTYSLLAPLLLTAAFSMLFLHRFSIFKPQVLNKFASPAHKGDMTVNILADIQVSQALKKDRPFESVQINTMLGELPKIITSGDQHIFPVLANDKLVGIANLEKIRSIMFNSDAYSMIIMADVMEPTKTLTLDMTLYKAMGIFLNDGHLELAVVDDQGKVVNILRYQDLIEAYHHGVNDHKKDSKEASFA
jgi:chloride channel protein, CIC family